MNLVPSKEYLLLYPAYLCLHSIRTPRCLQNRLVAGNLLNISPAGSCLTLTIRQVGASQSDLRSLFRLTALESFQLVTPYPDNREGY